MKAFLNVELPVDEVLTLVRQLPKEEKLKLLQELKKETYEKDLSSLLQSFRTDNITEDEINREVEQVREEIYENSKKADHL